MWVFNLLKDSDGAEEGGVSHQPVKPEFTRKKVRKATGYAKFNFSGGLSGHVHMNAVKAGVIFSAICG